MSPVVHELVAASVGSIVVLTDDSASAAAALRAAGAVARVTGARLHIVHGRDGPEVGDMLHRLDVLEKACLPRGVAPRSRTLTHKAETTVRQAAVEHWADLIVLGTQHVHARTRPAGVAAGQLLCACGCSCLVVNDSLVVPLRRVLVALELDLQQAGALHQTLRWVTLLGDAQGGTDVVVLHVLKPASHLEDTRCGEIMDRIIAAALADSVLPDWIRIRRSTVRHAALARAVVDTARIENAGLIVAGMHTRGFVVRAVIGSVALGITTHADRPVLLVQSALRFS